MRESIEPCLECGKAEELCAVERVARWKMDMHRGIGCWKLDRRHLRCGSWYRAGREQVLKVEAKAREHQ